MTDKQIIIDKINNSIEKEMKQLQDIARQIIGQLEAQLKRKEQECEELKEGQRCAWKSLEGTFCPEAQQQLDQLKAENDELKKKCNIYTCGICDNKEDCNKLYKTLTEIKEIAEAIVKGTHFTDNVEEHLKELTKQILQKISEVGNEITTR